MHYTTKTFTGLVQKDINKIRIIKVKKVQIQCNYNHYIQRQPVVIMDTAITSKKLIASYLIKTVTKHINQIQLYNIVKS